MKAKLNVTLEPDIIRKGKKIAKGRNLSLSQLIEILIQHCDRGLGDNPHWLDQYYQQNELSSRSISEDDIEKARKGRLR
jgi:hypothetical protein